MKSNYNVLCIVYLTHILTHILGQLDCFLLILDQSMAKLADARGVCEMAVIMDASTYDLN